MEVIMEINAPIGVFDSGVGGLTVAREIMRQIPNERIVYFGDYAKEYLEKYKDDYNNESDYEEQMIIQLSNVQKSKKNNNDKRVFWVQQSTFFLVLSALSLVVLNIVALI